jgi:phage-related protein
VIRSTRNAGKLPRLTVRFFRESTGSEPVRDWLKRLPAEEKREIGADIKTVQFGWPIGMPVVDHIDGDVWEVRTRLSTRIARVLFVLEGNVMVLLHGFIKKERKTPKADLDIAKQRLKKLRSST